MIGNTNVSLKIISQKLMAFAFDNTYLHQTFTEWVPNKYPHFDDFAMPDVTASYGTFPDFITFFLYYWHSCLKYCILTKLSQIVCLINRHILVYQHAK